MKILLASFFLFGFLTAPGQNNGFEFGRITYSELDMAISELDTSAAAIVLSEFGEAYIENGNDNNLLFEYHAKIKILKVSGIAEANIEIPLHKNNGKTERIRSIKASSFNKTSSSWSESKLEEKDIYTENINKYYDKKKFAVPNVQVGTVIEIIYILESPFIFNFRNWAFQSHLPKKSSEYWASIPGNYNYNITLKGFLKLTKNENEILRDCLTPGGPARADCIRYKFGMTNIPAFTVEDYMTAKSNFISAVNFELSEIKYFDGRVDKVTKSWNDVENELRNDGRFGVQIRKGKDITEEHVALAVAGETEELNKAHKIYQFIKDWFTWNETYGKYSELGIKKAFAERKGNVGDINLSLIAALLESDLSVEPVILSTRDNGLPSEIHPVLSDFNYVIAKLTIEGKIYLLDATDDFLPFGMLPERCLNGKGRCIGEKDSYWMDLKPTDKNKLLTSILLKMDTNGHIQGTIKRSFIGYQSKNQRKTIYKFKSEKDYFNHLSTKINGFEISQSHLENLNVPSSPLIETINIISDNAGFSDSRHLLFSPFIMEKWESNPFKSAERLYPVDFTIPIDETYSLTIELPENVFVSDLPERVGLALPNAGGRFLAEVKYLGNSLSVNSSLLISRTIYSSEEYHYLKELFNRIIQTQNLNIVFERR